MNLIGLAGRAGSGKDTVAQLCRRLMSGATVLSLSELIRAEVARSQAAPTRLLQRFVGDYRRKTAGGAYWVQRAIGETPEKTQALVLTGLYAPAEAAHVRTLGGVVVWIEASETCRLERIARRDGGTRDEQLSRDRVGFLQELEVEEGRDATGALVSLARVKELSDFSLANEGALEQLEVSLLQLLPTLNKRFSKRKGNIALLKSPTRIEYEAAQPWADEAQTLLRLEKSHFFEHFLAGKEASLEEINIDAETSLRDVVQLLYKPNLRSITGNQTARRIGTIFEHADPAFALSTLRAIKPSNPEEEYFTGMTDQEFYDVHLRAQVAWMQAEGDLQSKISETRTEIKEIDRMQFAGQKDRGLKKMRTHGLMLSVQPEHRRRIVELAHHPILNARPILEFIKNDRMFNVRGLLEARHPS